MAGFYHDFVTLRSTEPDMAALYTQARVSDPTIGISFISPGHYTLKKNTIWTAPQITFAQNVLDTAPAISPQLSAQTQVDQMSIFQKAILLTIIDQINLLRTQPATAFAAVTVQQAIDAVRTKAGTL